MNEVASILSGANTMLLIAIIWKLRDLGKRVERIEDLHMNGGKK